MSRLKKFIKKENEKIKKYAFLGTICLTIAVVSIAVSYAVYQREAETTFINAKVGEFKENDIELAIKLNGEQVDVPPAKDNYTVTVDCDNATGTWDMNEWGPNIRNITAGKVKCEVNFVTPKATLSEVTAIPYTTSIELTYTAAGIGTTTTCKYGTEENNYVNTVEGSTNSNCSITGLEKGVTYYYQVCAVNGGGEECKIGSAKTHPLSDQVQIGDYISMTPTSTSYTISKDLTGYSQDQTINPSELNLWRVIRKNDDGTVVMVSDKVSSTDVYFQGKEGYINLVGGLNTIAAQYTDGKNVASTRHIGYSNQTQTITDTSMLTATTRPWMENTCSSWTCTSSGFTEAQEAQGAGDIGYTTDYQLVNGVYSTMKANNPSGTATAYWLASRRYEYNSSTGWYFNGRYVDTIGGMTSNFLYHYRSNFSSSNRWFAVRPIVTLKSSTEISSGSGTSSSPFQLAD